MRLSKSVSVLKADEYASDTNVLKAGIIQKAEEKDTEFGKRVLLSFEDDHGESKAVFLNQQSIDLLIEGFGDDTDVWPGKKITIICRKGTGKHKQKMLLTSPFRA